MKMAKSPLFKFLILSWLVMLSIGGTAQAWWDGAWTIRKKITIDLTDKGAPISAPVGTATVLIRLHEGEFQFMGAKEDGSDIRFIAGDDKTLLKHHIEKFDSLLGEAFVWVKVPDVKPGAETSFWLYYGNQGDKAVRIDDAKGTYDADTVLVYHFGEKGTAPADSSTGGNNAEGPGVLSPGAMIGSGLRLDGQTKVTIPASPSLATIDGATLTWTAWVKLGSAQPNAIIFSREEGDKAFRVGDDNGVPFVEVKDASGVKRSPAGAPVAPNTWSHLAITAETGKLTVYLNGEPYASLMASLPALNAPSVIGGTAVEGGVGFIGEIDELQISKVARSAGLIKLAALAQGGEKGSKVLVSAAEETKGGGGDGHGDSFGILIANLTIDGWICIILCGGLGLFSWYVMYSKAVYLNAAGKGNEVFLAEWAQIASDLTALDHDDAGHIKTLGGRIDKAKEKFIKGSTVYRIYHIGAEEIRHRIALEKDKDNVYLSGQSIQAIRASMDAGMIRESDKLSSLMVFLTIAISGGPFIGLLGTVVGVMITFAAIAAAGDVNVNAIAPGIAAALLATVAGLGVAIPALFGYNYLTARVKQANMDMHIFADEFVTKMAEYYRPRGD